MTKEDFARQAAKECCSPLTTAHHGGAEGRPFWNPLSYQFMYVPAFQFQALPGVRRYRYAAKDERGVRHIFEADNASALLSPVWADIPEGVVELTVHALDNLGRETYLVGARTFFKLASFPADLPPAARGYREAAAKAFEYAMSQTFITHWLTDGTPDPDYDLNVYPSKMIASIVNAMLDYARVSPEKAQDALTVAKNAADYLLTISYGAGSPLAGLPPTYYMNFREHPEKRSNLTAADRIGTCMMIYPASAGIAYLNLEAETKDKKYLDAALTVGDWYRSRVLDNGSWHLIINVETGEPATPEICDPLEVIAPFLIKLFERTGDSVWKTLADGATAYAEKTATTTYDWRGQFEDSLASVNYSNLTHYGASALARYYVKYHADDPELTARAQDLMRFVEDQFIIWKRPSPWNKSGFDTSLWHTPCGLEQYQWHVPIDASTSHILQSFLEMHKAGLGELYLEKAKALADSITRIQQPNGVIPTHWMLKDDIQFWINCMFHTAKVLAELADYLDSL